MATNKLNAIRKNRITKLKSWIDNDFEGNVAAFCRKFNLPPGTPSYISQLFSSGRNFGEKAARSLEAQTGRPNGWFDTETASNTPAIEAPLFHFDRQRAAKLPIAERKLVSDFIEFLIQKNDPISK